LQTLQGPAAAGGAAEAAAVGAPRGVLGAVRLIVAADGVRGLYRGLTPALLRAAPANAAVFLIYETLTRALSGWH